MHFGDDLTVPHWAKAVGHDAVVSGEILKSTHGVFTEFGACGYSDQRFQEWIGPVR